MQLWAASDGTANILAVFKTPALSSLDLWLLKSLTWLLQTKSTIKCLINLTTQWLIPNSLIYSINQHFTWTYPLYSVPIPSCAINLQTFQCCTPQYLHLTLLHTTALNHTSTLNIAWKFKLGRLHLGRFTVSYKIRFFCSIFIKVIKYPDGYEQILGIWSRSTNQMLEHILRTCISNDWK